MELLRSWCGQKTILGCGVPVMPAFGLVDYCRVSCDVSLDWNDVWYMRLFHRERVSTKQAINNTVFRRQLNGRAYGSDPDVFFLREENCKLTAEQTAVSISGICWAEHRKNFVSTCFDSANKPQSNNNTRPYTVLCTRYMGGCFAVLPV